MEFVNPFPITLWRKSKSSRSNWRATHNTTRKRVVHGGRGRKFGIKGRKNAHRG